MDGLEKELRELEELKNIVSQIEGMTELNLDNFEFMSEFKVKTKFTNNSNNPDPEYAKIGDSGFDIRANLTEPIVLKPLERVLVPTGLRFELSPNTELQVRPRSGMALKHGISVLNTPGTVDEGYRGEIGVIVINLSNENYTINHGERIAQGVIANVINQSISELIKTNDLSDSERGSDGFGSTGKG